MLRTFSHIVQRTYQEIGDTKESHGSSWARAATAAQTSSKVSHVKRVFLFPKLDLSVADCSDWFKIIGFSYESLNISGEKLLSGDDDSWKNFEKKLEAYKVKIVKCPGSKAIKQFCLPSRPARLPIALNEAIYEVFYQKYCDMPYSCVKFSNIIQEIVTGVRCPPPEREHPPSLEQSYFAPYTLLLQSSMAGKTCFLLTPIKENHSLRVVVIYFPMQSSIGELGMELMYRISSASWEGL